MQPVSVRGYCTGDLERGDICGVWSLRSRSFLPTLHSPEVPSPLKFKKKEFTTYPKKKKKIPPQTAIEEEEILLMLRDDGTFVQYGKISPEDIPDADDEGTDDPAQKEVSRKLAALKMDRKSPDSDSGSAIGIMKGTWDFIDGQLILANDRPDDVIDIRSVHDTVLVGDVVVKSAQSLEANPASVGLDKGAPEDKEGEKKDYGKNDGSFDVHISVPQGSVESGKFMYPKNHPSFFDQLIYKPTHTGSFQLRQVLGSLNTKIKDEIVEKFKVEDLQNKRYLLTTFPLKQRRRKIGDVKPHERAEAERKLAEEEDRPVPIQTVEIMLFQNMTFATAAGFGGTKILRGKWSIIGADKDQLWMQVLRFGFGRSVSGSTFSEGLGLTHEDQKAYWGRILDVNEAGVDDEGADAKPAPSDESEEPKAVEINGSVLDGLGLEPLPVARFTMIEETEVGDDDDLDDDDDEDEIFRQSLEGYGFGASQEGEEEIDPISSFDAFQ